MAVARQFVGDCLRGCLVVGANGDLTGFAGGLEVKGLLLGLERDDGASMGRMH
jgi:hypothetical protein